MLSACDTGHGVVMGSEGVFGLVRAFRAAGAGQVLMTLAPVPDAATAELMAEFYKRWLKHPGTDPAAALRALQHEYARSPDPRKNAPRVWAPFVVVG